MTNRLLSTSSSEFIGGTGLDDGVTREGEGGSPAPLFAHLRSDCVINGQSLQISRRVCSVEESQRLKKEKNEVLLLLGGKKYNPVSHFYCTGRDQMALCYDWAFWAILSSRLQQRGDDSS